MSSLPILDRERKRKSKKERSRVAQSPARQVNSLPRPSLRQVTLIDPIKLCRSESSRVPIFGLPKRSSSFHVKSASISCERLQPTSQPATVEKMSDRKDKSLGDLSSTTPLAPRRFSSQEMIKRSTSESISDDSHSKPAPPILSPSISICSPISSLSRLTSGSTSSLEEVIEEEDLRILSDDESVPSAVTARRTSQNKEEESQNKKNEDTPRISTQSAPGHMSSSSMPATPKELRTTSRFTTTSVPATPRMSFDSSSRRSSRTGKPAAETDGLIKTGKVAALLHRFSSTNRGKINSVYYDSNSEDEDQPHSFTLARMSHRKNSKKQEEDLNQDEDHLSTLFDATLEILAHIENEDDFSEVDEKL
ncbi:unnamed protein product [Oikopleura dioica]|uniref:Uncharacterized protein n=1 Tax=Oikopleura dioica TaxID=34765 RepID=E4Y8N8_OIKDI|nr:unnamed protein product [Oikopleura dioica]